jgi:hypothetical protein
VTSRLSTESSPCRNHGANKPYGRLELLVRPSLHSFMGPEPR